jgi:hypothetical protein
MPARHHTSAFYTFTDYATAFGVVTCRRYVVALIVRRRTMVHHRAVMARAEAR